MPADSAMRTERQLTNWSKRWDLFATPASSSEATRIQQPRSVRDGAYPPRSVSLWGTELPEGVTAWAMAHLPSASATSASVGNGKLGAYGCTTFMMLGFWATRPETGNLDSLFDRYHVRRGAWSVRQ